jgi:hypothetical protein
MGISGEDTQPAIQLPEHMRPPAPRTSPPPLGPIPGGTVPATPPPTPHVAHPPPPPPPGSNTSGPTASTLTDPAKTVVVTFDDKTKGGTG